MIKEISNRFCARFGVSPTGTPRISALCMPFFMVAAFMSLGLVAHLAARPAQHALFGLSFPGQGLLEAVNPQRLMEGVVWLPFRDSKRILYRDLPQDSSLYKQELHCLAQAVYFEARSEPLEGQIAVAQVVLNRVQSPYYPKSICGVVYQGASHRHGCQFSFACDGLADKPINPVAWKHAMIIAETAVSRQEDDITLDSIYYHAISVDPSWATTMKPTVKLGRHIFYREI